MMKTTKRLTGIFLATLLFIVAIPTFEVEAAGRSDVTVSDSVFGKYLVTKKQTTAHANMREAVMLHESFSGFRQQDEDTTLRDFL